MAEPIIVDTSAPGFNDDDVIHVGDYHNSGGYHNDPPPQRRPSMAQRLSRMSIHEHDTEERRPSHVKAKRDSISANKNFVYWRLDKIGEDWAEARRIDMPAPQAELEKMAKKGKGTVLSETTKMGGYRSQQLKRLIDDANAEEFGDATWEPVFVSTNKAVRRNSKAIEVRSMDVILARVANTVKLAKVRSKSRTRSFGGQVVNVLESNPRSKDKDTDKKKDKVDEGGKEYKKKDTVMDDDPFCSQPLFSPLGKPMDERGEIQYHNGGLPAEIPRDRPIGAKLEKRGKSKDRGHGDEPVPGGVEVIDDPISVSGGVETIDAILRQGLNGGGGGGDRGPSSSHRSNIEAEPGRSRSRRRPSQSRSKSRLRSRSRPESIHIPSNYYTRSYMGDHHSSGSSISSDSRREDRSSSFTSLDDYDQSHMARRGSQYRYEKAGSHKQHYRGPGRDTSQRPYYHDRPVYERRRSYSRPQQPQAYGYYRDAIPESRQIEYGRDLEYDLPLRRERERERELMVRQRPYDGNVSPTFRRPVELHYPDDLVDLKASERAAETYMRANVTNDYLDQQERDLRRREMAVEAEEEEAARRRDDDERRRREYENYGRRYSQSRGGYYDDGRYNNRWDGRV